MTMTGRAPASGDVDDQLWAALWHQIESRLANGEPLLTYAQFEAAIEAAYQGCTGHSPSEAYGEPLRRAVSTANSEFPDTFLARGVQNGVQSAFVKAVRLLAWDVVRVQRYGVASVRRFLNRERIRGLLDEISMDPGLIDVTACVRHGLSSARAPQAASGGAAPATTGGDTHPRAQDFGPILESGLEPRLEYGAHQAALDVRRGDRLQARARVKAQKRIREELHAQERQRLLDRLDIYVADGLLTEAEAEQSRELARIDAAADGDPFGAAADGARQNSIVDARQRRRLERAVRDAIDHSVSCLQVFAALQRINPEYDGLLKLLIRHKQHVVDGGRDRTLLMTTLVQTRGLLDLALGAIQRRDLELHLLAARLPPYDSITPHELEAVVPLAIEESFVDDLRSTTVEKFAERLYADDPDERTRARDDLHGLIQLIDHVTEPTPFRRKVRLLAVNRMLEQRTAQVEELYRSCDRQVEARHRAERMLLANAEEILADATAAEESSAHKRIQALLTTVEQRFASQWDEAARQRPDSPGELADDGGPPEAGRTEAESTREDRELSDVEKRRGAVVARVHAGIVGRRKTSWCVVMPSPLDAKRFVMMQRERESGELVPQERRGRLRHVNRNRDGSWHAATG